MGRASRKKREQRETEEKPVEWVDLVVQAGVATASAQGCDG
jgi:hypothetical protein